MKSQNKEVIETIKENKTTIELNKIQNLIDKGADLNKTVEFDEELGGSFFCDCLEICDNNIDTLPLLKLFIKNGYNIDKYGLNILEDIRFFNHNKSVIETAKFILNNFSNKVDLSEAIEAVETEASYNCCTEKDDFSSNYLYTLCDVLKHYHNNENFDNVFDMEKIKGQKVLDISISGKLEKHDDDTVFIDENPNDISVKMIIKCEKDTLIIKDTDYVCINNNEKFVKEESSYVSLLKDNIVGEIIEDINFEHYSYKVGDNSYAQGRNASIILSNSKRIIFKTIYDQKCLAIKYANVKNARLLNKFPNVFIERELSVLDKDIVMPEMSAKLKIFHNCDVNYGARLSFQIISRDDDLVEDDDSITIDVESFELLRPYIEKYILNFDEYDEINPIKIETYLEMVEELKLLLSDLKNDNYTEKYINCAKSICGWIDETTCDYEKTFDNILLQVIDFIEAFIWYFSEYKQLESNPYSFINIIGY